MSLEFFYSTDSIRRKDRIMDKEQTIRLIETGEYGILSTVSSDGHPYGVPLSYAVHENVIYIHCAPEGEKIENINYENRATFTIVGKIQVIEDEFATRYESAILKGEIYFVEDEKEKIKALMLLGRKYCLPAIEKAPAYIQKSLFKTCIFKFVIKNITGKKRR